MRQPSLRPRLSALHPILGWLIAVALLLGTPTIHADADTGTERDTNTDLFQGGQVALTTDYLYRGVSQTSGEATLQAGLDFGWKSLSWSLWSSRVDFSDGGTARTEVDLGVAWSRSLSEALELTVGLGHFVYLEERDSDYSEVYAALGAGPFELAVHWTPDYFGLGVDASYFAVGAAFELAPGLELGLHAGRNVFDDEDPGEETPAYWDAHLALRRSFGRFDVELLYSETTLDDDPNARDRLVVTLATAF